MMDLGDLSAGQPANIYFSVNEVTGERTAASQTPGYAVYRDGMDADFKITSGSSSAISMIEIDDAAGRYCIVIDTSVDDPANFFEGGHDYAVYAYALVDGIGSEAVVGRFSIENRSHSHRDMIIDTSNDDQWVEQKLKVGTQVVTDQWNLQDRNGDPYGLANANNNEPVFRKIKI